MIPRTLQPEPWMDLAVCQEFDPELWFPEENSVTALGSPVRALCRSCEVRLQCLTFALQHGEEGIWGGFTGSVRRKILTQHNHGRPLEDIIAEDDEAWFASVEAQQQRRAALCHVTEPGRKQAAGVTAGKPWLSSPRSSSSAPPARLPQ